MTLAAWGQEAYWNALIGKFREEHPNVEIELYTRPFSEYFDGILTMLAAGTAPDIFVSNPQHAPIFIESGAWLDLTPLVTRDDFPFEDYLEMGWAYGRRDGKYFAWPAGIDPAFPSHLWAYNRDLLESAGLAGLTPDWTFADLVDVTRRLTIDRNGDGTVDLYGMTAPNVTWYWNWVWSNGGRILSDDGKEFALTEPQAVEALQLLADLRGDRYGVTAPGTDLTSVFTSGQAALYNTSLPSVFRMYADGTGFDWDIVPYPRGNAGSIARAGDLPLGINAATQHAEEAWAFLKWMLRQDVQQWAVDTGIITAPVHREVVLSAFVWEPRYPFTFQPLLEQEYRVLPVFRGWNELDQAVQRAIQRAFQQNVSVQVALEEIRPTVETILSGNR